MVTGGAETAFPLREDLVAVARPALIGNRGTLAALGLQVEQAMAGPRYVMAGPRYELFSMLAQAARCHMGVVLVPRFLLEEELAEGKLMVANPHLLTRGNAYFLVCPEARADGRGARPLP